MTSSLRHGVADTRARLLRAAEQIFVESGYEAMSLRQITAAARANLAAVNYHFGGKEALMQQLLSQRLDQLNHERLLLLDACEQQWPDNMSAEAVMGMLFVPAFRRGRDGTDGPNFMRLLGRVYCDSSPFIRNYLQEHYRPIFGRFFEAFSRVLPEWPRSELGLRLHFCLKSLSGILAGEDMQDLIHTISMGQEISDAELLARLISLISPVLTAPFGSPAQVQMIDRVLRIDAQIVLAPGHPSNKSVPSHGVPPSTLAWTPVGGLQEQKSSTVFSNPSAVRHPPLKSRTKTRSVTKGESP